MAFPNTSHPDGCISNVGRDTGGSFPVSFVSFNPVGINRRISHLFPGTRKLSAWKKNQCWQLFKNTGNKGFLVQSGQNGTDPFFPGLPFWARLQIHLRMQDTMNREFYKVVRGRQNGLGLQDWKSNTVGILHPHIQKCRQPRSRVFQISTEQQKATWIGSVHPQSETGNRLTTSELQSETSDLSCRTSKMDLANQPLAAGPRKPLHPYGSEIPTERHSSLSKDLPHSSLSGSMSRSTWESQQYHINREDQNNIKALKIKLSLDTYSTK